MNKKTSLTMIILIIAISSFAYFLAPNNNEILDVSKQWINNSKYVMGGGRSEKDIAKGHFDTSSYVHWVYKEIGVDLGPVETVSTETLRVLGKKVPISNIQEGDLIFWDTYKKDGHVGIYIGNNEWIGCQINKGVSIETLDNPYFQKHFTGHVRRILN